MITKYLKITILALFLSVLIYDDAQAQAQEQKQTAKALFVYKTPTCGCCKKWISHITEQGIVAYSKDYNSLDFIKNKYGIKPNLRSCHTAVTQDGFAFEGHVPAKFIQQFLSKQHPNAIGLSVPAMPLGSPGMEVGDRFMPYKVLLLNKDGTSEVYAQVNTYEEQF
ncbi:DUF411 domain-containing protein [Thalassotalea fusca]